MSLRYLSISQLSEVSGKDRRTVSKRLAGLAPYSIDGGAILYDAPAALEAILFVGNSQALDKKLAHVQLQVEQERLTKLQLENGETSGQLVSIEEVAKTVEREYSIIRSQLRSLPTKLAKPLSMVTDPTETFNRLSEGIEECLTELVSDENYERECQRIAALTRASTGVPSNRVEAQSETEPGGMGGQLPLSESGVVEHSGQMEDLQRGGSARADASSKRARRKKDHSHGTDPASQDGAD